MGVIIMAILGNLTGLIGLACAIWVIYDVLVNNKKMTTGLNLAVCLLVGLVTKGLILLLTGKEFSVCSLRLLHSGHSPRV